MNPIKKFWLDRKLYQLLKRKYPDYVWHNEIEKLYDGDFSEIKKTLSYWGEKGYIKKRDSRGRGEFPDDMLYTLTAKGLDELSIISKIKNLIPLIGCIK